MSISFMNQGLEEVVRRYYKLIKGKQEFYGKSALDALSSWYIEKSGKGEEFNQKMVKKYGKDFGNELETVLREYHMLYGVIDVGAQFFVKTDSMDEILNTIIENLDNYSNKDFCKIPKFETFSIFFENKEGDGYAPSYIVCNEFNNMYEIVVFYKHSSIAFGYFNMDKLPRVYLVCPNSKDCKYFPEAVIEGKVYCRKVPRTCKNCNWRMQGNDPNSVNETVAERFVISTLIMFEVFKKFNDPVEVIEKIKNNIKERKKGTNVSNGDIGMIEIGKTRYKYINYDTTENDEEREKIERKGPCEHIRRGHYRRMKSGKLIYIEQQVVCKGNGKKIYKV